MLSASVDNTLLDLQNSSYPTQPHSIIAKYIDLGQPKSVAPSGQIVEKPIKLPQEKVKF